jgi:hypothetical protein
MNANFRKKIKPFLFKHIDGKANLFKRHFFRADIPDALSNSPNLASDGEINRWAMEQ